MYTAAPYCVRPSPGTTGGGDRTRRNFSIMNKLMMDVSLETLAELVTSALAMVRSREIAETSKTLEV